VGSAAAAIFHIRASTFGRREYRNEYLSILTFFVFFLSYSFGEYGCRAFCNGLWLEILDMGYSAP